MFCEHAAGAIAVERQLYESFFKQFGLTEEQVRRTEMAPQRRLHGATCRGLRWLVSRSPRRGSPLLLDLLRSEEDPSRAGLSGPSVPEVDRYLRGRGVRRHREGCARPPRRNWRWPSAGEESKVAEHFRNTTRFEWMFWDMGNRKEGWPV